jgi:hypothetical protein
MLQGINHDVFYSQRPREDKPGDHSTNRVSLQMQLLWAVFHDALSPREANFMLTPLSGA